jgi:protein-S-isoprenylcysteine O-methyltransferase Ste14
MSDEGFIQRGGLWIAVQHTLTLAVLALGPLFRGQWRDGITTIVGFVLFGVGGCFGIAGVRALGRNRTASPQPLADSTLVQHGVYGVVRHPLYSSLMFVSVGWAMIWGSSAALMAAGALTLLLHAKARREERWLRERYPEYRDYERRMKRYVPGVW